MSYDAVTAAPVPINLGGTEYLVSPLTDKDLVSLDEYIRHIHIKTAVDSCKNMPQEIADKALSMAVKQASSMTFMSPEGAGLIKSVAGVARILWLGIKHNHPTVTHEDISAKMLDKRNIAEANRVFKRLNVDPMQDLLGKAAPAVRRRQGLKSTKRSLSSTKSRPKK